jgi:hypothetical protein
MSDAFPQPRNVTSCFLIIEAAGISQNPHPSIKGSEAPEDGNHFAAHRVNLQKTLGEARGMLDKHNAHLKLPEVLDAVAGTVCPGR